MFAWTRIFSVILGVWSWWLDDIKSIPGEDWILEDSGVLSKTDVDEETSCTVDICEWLWSTAAVVKFGVAELSIISWFNCPGVVELAVSGDVKAVWFDISSVMDDILLVTDVFCDVDFSVGMRHVLSITSGLKE